MSGPVVFLVAASLALVATKPLAAEERLRLVKDIHTSTASSFPLAAVVLGDRLLFSAYQPATGFELWSTDLTENGTQFVVEVDPSIYFGTAVSGGATLEFFVSDGLAYFVGFTLAEGRELWRTDGTAEGTFLLGDIREGPLDSVVMDLVEFQGQVWFVAYSDDSGWGLWRTDGTAAGTELALDLEDPFLGEVHDLTVLGDLLLLASTIEGGGEELIATDGTEAGTEFIEIRPGGGGSLPRELIAYGEVALFSADDGTSGRELWKTDGTDAGTELVADIELGSGSSNPTRFVLHEGVAFFQARTAVTGTELWITKGTEGSTDPWEEIAPGAASSNAMPLASALGELYFSATDGSNGVELWRTDYTDFGVVMVSDLEPGAGNSNPRSLVEFDGHVFFSAFTSETSFEIARSDGSKEGATIHDLLPGPQSPSSAALVKPLLFFEGKLVGAAETEEIGLELYALETADSEPEFFADVNDDTADGLAPWIEPICVVDEVLIFSGVDAEHGNEPWRSDGTADGTELLVDIHPNPGTGGSAPNWFLSFGGVGYFAARESEAYPPLADQQLWSTDGTAVGTKFLGDPDSTEEGADPSWLARFGDALLFRASSPGEGRELWTSKGTPSSTRMLEDLNTGTGSSDPDHFIDAGGVAYFAARTSAEGTELWRTDGTADLTALVADINAGAGSSFPSAFSLLGDEVIFRATTAATGHELYKLNASEEVVLVADIRPGAFSGMSAGGWIIALGDIVLFAASDADHGQELWKSDGTEGGTELVLDIEPGSGDSSPREPTVFDGELYFFAENSESGRELWKSDGTTAGTVLVADLVEGAGSSRPFDTSYPPLLAFDGRLFFQAYREDVGFELFATDGTEPGTQLVHDTYPGPISAEPIHLTVANDKLYAFAYGEEVGVELHVLAPVAFKRGDVNGDGTVAGVSDSLALLAWSFSGGADPPCLDAADVNGNNVVQGIADTLYLLAYAFTGGAAPPAPGPTTCGEDPDDDTNLRCADPPAVCDS